MESSAVSPNTSAAVGPDEILDGRPYRLPASMIVARPSGAIDASGLTLRGICRFLITRSDTDDTVF